MDDKTTAKELDGWIARLEECKQLEEKQIQILCDKVRASIWQEVSVAGQYGWVYLIWCTGKIVVEVKYGGTIEPFGQTTVRRAGSCV